MFVLSTPDEFFAQILIFLREGGDDDAAFVLEQCERHASTVTRRDLGTMRTFVTVYLTCTRLPYDLLRDPQHPIRRAIEYAIQALVSWPSDSYDIELSAKSGEAPLEARRRLMELKKRPWVEELVPRHPINQRPRPALPDTGATAQVAVDSQLCFVIMSFSGNPQLQDFYEKAVKPAIRTMGYRCERVDEQEFNDSIRQKILDNIHHARFIVADMTEARPNCYYELGIAHALGKEVIHIARDMKDVHFDVNDFNFIVYEQIDDLKGRLRERIQKTIGRFQPVK